MNIKYAVLISSVSFLCAEEAQPSVVVEADDEIVINAEKVEKSVFVPQIYIDTETFLESAPMQKRITAKEAMNFPGVQGDPIKAVKYVAGVTSNGSGELMIHASKPRENNYNINHLPIGYLFHMGGMHSVIAPESIEQLDVYLGGFDSSYGDSIGGVLDITQKYYADNRESYIHLGIFDSSAGINTNIGDNTMLSVHARRSYFDLLVPEVGDLGEDEDKLTYTVFPNYWDVNGIVAYNYDNHQFSIEAISAGDELAINSQANKEKDPEATGDIEMDIGFTTLGFRWTYDNGFIQTNTLSYYKTQREDVELFNNYYIDIEDTTIGMYHISTIDLDKHRISLGCDIEKFSTPVKGYVPAPPQEDDVDFELTTATKYLVDEKFDIISYSIFAQDVYQINNDMKIRYGFRGKDSDFNNYSFEIMPRLSMIYDVNESNTLSLSTGMYSKTADGHKHMKLLGNPEVSSEKSIHYALSWTNKITDEITLVLEPYYKSLYDLAIDDDTDNYKNEGKGFVYGADLTLTMRTDDIYLYGTYSYITSERELNTKDNNEYRFYGEKPHNLQAACSYNFSPQWIFSALVKYESGKPYTPIIGTYKYTDTDSSERIRPTYGEPFSERLPDYFSLNLKAAWTKKLSHGVLESSFEIMNATFHDNVSGIRYDKDYNKDGYYYDLPMLPWLDITYKF